MAREPLVVAGEESLDAFVCEAFGFSHREDGLAGAGSTADCYASPGLEQIEDTGLVFGEAYALCLLLCQHSVECRTHVERTSEDAAKDGEAGFPDCTLGVIFVPPVIEGGPDPLFDGIEVIPGADEGRRKIGPLQRIDVAQIRKEHRVPAKDPIRTGGRPAGMFPELRQNGILGRACLSCGILDAVHVAAAIRRRPSAGGRVESDSPAFDCHRRKAMLTMADHEVRLAIVRMVVRTLKDPADGEVHVIVVGQPVSARPIDGRLASGMQRTEFAFGEFRIERRHRTLPRRWSTPSG